MQEIRMVDLKGQYQNIKSEIDMAIEQVIESTAFINGPQVKTFAQNLAKYLDVKHVIPCANGTDALQISLMALGLRPGDEVITPDFTFIATVEVVALLGLKPVLVDVDPVYFTMDPAAIGKAITKNTKAIVPVHLYGLCANMEEITSIAREHNLYVVEDAAQAVGTNYHGRQLKGKAGTLGDIGTTSFFPSKNLGCYGDGGALYTNNSDLAGKISIIANHGGKVKYYHDIAGVNSRLDTMQAAILNVKLKYLDLYCSARAAAAEFYTSRLQNIDQLITPSIPDYSDHVFHQYTIRLKQRRDELKEYLLKKGIPSMIYYPVPMHRQKYMATEGDFGVSDQLSREVLSLPMHTELTAEQQNYICNNIESFFA